MKDVVELPAHGEFRRVLAFDPLPVGVQASRSPVQIAFNGFRRRFARPDRAIDALSSQRVEDAGGISCEQNVTIGQIRPPLAYGKVVSTHTPEIRRIKPVRTDELVKLRAQRGANILPTSDAYVQMVSLWEHPTIPARHAAEVEPHGCFPFAGERTFSCNVPFQGNPMHKVRWNACHPGASSISTVRDHQSSTTVSIPTGADGYMIAFTFDAVEALTLQVNALRSTGERAEIALQGRAQRSIPCCGASALPSADGFRRFVVALLWLEHSG